MVTLDGAPWFVAADVCVALGYRIPKGGSASMFMRGLNDDETRLIHRNTAETSLGIRGYPYLLAVSESGLYKLIGRAQRVRPEVAAFQDWLNGTVLPAIRKDHGYIAGEEKGARSVDQT